jgi:Nucleotidyl transferase AbiEii toxin, Type IV TA system
MNGLRIRPLRPDEISIAVNWAAAEGWNPGFANDFYDISILAQTCAFKDDRLARAIAATFARRKTEIPNERPDGFTSTFASDPTKQQQWNGFVEEVAVNPAPVVDVVEALACILLPHAKKARKLHAKR